MTKRESAEIIRDQNGSCDDKIKVSCLDCFLRDNYIQCKAAYKALRKQAAEEYLANFRPVPTQPAPTPNCNAHIADLVMADILNRKQKGIETYGTPLQAHNGRDALVDAYEEALDLCCYLKQAIEERG